MLSIRLKDKFKKFKRVRKIEKILFTAFLSILFLFWIFLFVSLFNGLVNEASVIQEINFTAENIRAVKIFGWVSIIFFILLPVYDVWFLRKNQFFDSLKNQFFYTSKFTILLTEISIALYVAASLFTFRYEQFEPRFIFVLGGLVGFVLLEKFKEWFLRKINHFKIEDY